MAIEPISSAMTFNAQPVAQQMTAPKPVEKSAEEFTEGSMQNAAAPVDNVTLSVNAAQAKDGESGSQQGNQQEQQPSASAEAVKKAVPLYENHVQPKVPLNRNYYDPTNIETLKYQSSLMKKYGVDGLCFYHYYFN